jgi:hypothetical protein
LKEKIGRLVLPFFIIFALIRVYEGGHR